MEGELGKRSLDRGYEVGDILDQVETWYNRNSLHCHHECLLWKPNHIPK